jgi:hypothetical protein
MNNLTGEILIDKANYNYILFDINTLIILMKIKKINVFIRRMHQIITTTR